MNSSRAIVIVVGCSQGKPIKNIESAVKVTQEHSKMKIKEQIQGDDSNPIALSNLGIRRSRARPAILLASYLTNRRPPMVEPGEHRI
jgi:hypothetical protein